MSLERYLEQQRQAQLDGLLDFLRIPSVSTDPERRDDVRRAAEYARARLEAIGFDAELIDTAGHPVVLAERHVSDDAPTVLVYGHYDVQPAEPLEEWERPPFEPTVTDGAIVARGASDDKGQVYAHIEGAAALLAVDGELPLNVRFLIEGEEEIGSPHLESFIDAHRERLAADVVVISDGAMIAPGTPTITYGLKGLAYVEVRVRGAGRDLHSGAYGGGVPNAINALAEMIAGLHDADGRVSVPGFYDRVRPLDEAERERLATVPFDEAEFRTDSGVRATPGEAGYSLLERLWARPTLDVNGIAGGFQGKGAKTVIAARAMAKISCRLVPDQDPQEITRLLGEELKRRAPAGVSVEVEDLHGGLPAYSPIDGPGVQAAAEALRGVYGREPVYARTGGTIPVVSTFQSLLGAEVVLVGFGLENDRAHSPNEKFELDNYYRGVHTSAELLRRLARKA